MSVEKVKTMLRQEGIADHESVARAMVDAGLTPEIIELGRQRGLPLTAIRNIWTQFGPTAIAILSAFLNSLVDVPPQSAAAPRK